jgi:hypothetical protein
MSARRSLRVACRWVTRHASMAEDRQTQWPMILVAAGQALGRALGANIAIRNPTPMIDGWSAQHGEYPYVRRCEADAPSPSTVIVKARRPAAQGRERIRREGIALTLFEEVGSNAGPRVLARREDFIVLEDLGRGPALEDVLVAHDPRAATDALVALARTLGAMQVATHGRHDAFYRPLASGVDPRTDRVTLGGATIAQHWATLGELASVTGLPATRSADADLDEVTASLAEPGALLAVSSGDIAPQNCRLIDRSVRLLDFERACYRHALLDAAHLRLPFCGAPCWARLPAEVSAAMEDAYRAELAPACPALLDQRAYSTGMATATAAWAVTRLVRVPKLLAQDQPHPMGFSRRGQLVDTMQSAIDAAEQAGSLIALRAWLERVVAALRRIWPGLPAAQEVYPAFRGRP